MGTHIADDFDQEDTSPELQYEDTAIVRLSKLETWIHEHGDPEAQSAIVQSAGFAENPSQVHRTEQVACVHEMFEAIPSVDEDITELELDVDQNRASLDLALAEILDEIADELDDEPSGQDDEPTDEVVCGA